MSNNRIYEFVRLDIKPNCLKIFLCLTTKKEFLFNIWIRGCWSFGILLPFWVFMRTLPALTMILNTNCKDTLWIGNILSFCLYIKFYSLFLDLMVCICLESEIAFLLPSLDIKFMYTISTHCVILIKCLAFILLDWIKSRRHLFSLIFSHY